MPRCFRVIDVKLRKVQFQGVVTNLVVLLAGAWCRMILGVTSGRKREACFVYSRDGSTTPFNIHALRSLIMTADLHFTNA